MNRAIACITTFLLLATLAVSSGPGGPTPAMAIRAGKVHAEYNPNRGKVFVLVIGNDARRGNPNRSLADAIHVVGVNTETMKGGVLNFPRDSWVAIPGFGSGKINEALFEGGPELLARTIEQLTKIRIDYWVMVGFEGFQAIIRRLGGVKVHLPYAIYDQGGSGAQLRAGTQKLLWWEALAYARARKSLPNGDIDRTRNQARILLALLAKLRREVADNPASLINWMTATKLHARFDLSSDEMFRLGVLASQVAPKDVGSATVPVSLGWVGAESVAFISPGAPAIYRRFRKTASF